MTTGEKRLRVIYQLRQNWGELVPPEDLRPLVEIVDAPTKEPIDPQLVGDILLTAPSSRNAYEIAERGVRWVHLNGTGLDGADLVRLGEGRIVTNSRGAAAVPISEWVLAMMLAFAKDLPNSWISESPGAWRPDFQLKSLYGAQLALVGIGSIGTAVAVRARAFGMKIRALRRSPRGIDLPGVEVAGTMADLLRDADHVVIAAPLTPETRHIIDATAFSSMKPGVHLVNISRGGLVDQDALRDALDRGIVGRASLDTVTPEPLPDGHWLYSHPRVLLSPHISYLWPHSKETLFSFFMENLRRFVQGEDLINIVDPAAGY